MFVPVWRFEPFGKIIDDELVVIINKGIMSEKDIKKENIDEELKDTNGSANEMSDAETAEAESKSSDCQCESCEEKEDNSDKKSDKKSKKAEKKSKKECAEDKLEELGNKLQEINDKYLRLSAEFDNYRKRTLKEKMELTKSAGEKIFVNILPVMDNFERALKSLEDAKDIEAVKEGIDLIYTNFGDFLKHNGVEAIDAADVEFDTDLHEAVTKIPAPSEEMKGKVVDCIQKGYKLNDKVIRYSKVVIGE